MLLKGFQLPSSRFDATIFRQKYTNWSNDFSVTICKCYKDVYVNSFFPRKAKMYYLLPSELDCFQPLTILAKKLHQICLTWS